ncbi:unnamed protein product, partial [Prorocentrum cordatum]
GSGLARVLRHPPSPLSVFSLSLSLHLSGSPAVRPRGRDGEDAKPVLVQQGRPRGAARGGRQRRHRLAAGARQRRLRLAAGGGRRRRSALEPGTERAGAAAVGAPAREGKPSGAGGRCRVTRQEGPVPEPQEEEGSRGQDFVHPPGEPAAGGRQAVRRPRRGRPALRASARGGAV